MPIDRFISYPQGAPEPARVQVALEDFLGGAGTVKWDEDRFYVTLEGRHSWALQRTFPGSARARDESSKHPTRWIEVWCSNGTIDVMTREQDDFTRSIAEGIADTLAKPFDGVREPT